MFNVQIWIQTDIIELEKSIYTYDIKSISAEDILETLFNASGKCGMTHFYDAILSDTAFSDEIYISITVIDVKTLEEKAHACSTFFLSNLIAKNIDDPHTTNLLYNIQQCLKDIRDQLVITENKNV